MGSQPGLALLVLLVGVPGSLKVASWLGWQGLREELRYGPDLRTERMDVKKFYSIL